MIKVSKLRTVTKDKGLKKLNKIFKDFKNAYSLIGLFSDSKNSDGLFLAFIGAVNDFGTKDGRIPERPWMRGWFDSNIAKITKLFQVMSQKILDGVLTPEAALKMIGAWGENELKKEITNLRTPPNASSTIKKKKSSNPLIDTGQMRNSIKSKTVISKKGDPPKESGGK